MHLECKKDTIASTSVSSSDYSSDSKTDYPSESIIDDKPYFCIPYNELKEMEKNAISTLSVAGLSLLLLIFIICSKKSKILAGTYDLEKKEEKQSEIPSKVPNNGQNNPPNNISSFQVNQIDNNIPNIPNAQIVDVNTQVRIEKSKKNKHKSIKVKVENKDKYKGDISSKEKIQK